MAGQLGEKMESLRESETRFRNYFELGLIGMAIVSPKKGWIEANDTLLEMLGYSLEELQASTWPELTHPEDLERDVTQFNRVLAGEIDGYSSEKRYLRKTGEVMHAMLATKCMRKANGEVDYVLVLIDDITDRKAWEYALANMNRDLQSRVVEGKQELSATSDRLNAALARLESAQATAIQTEKLSTIGQMVAAIAHELRNPLMGIVNYVQYAQECKDPDRRAEVLGKASRGLSTLSKTVNNMLRFSRPHEGKARPFSPDGPVRDALTLVSAELRGRGIQTELRLEKLGQVIGEEHALQQVFLNLLINARDAVSGVAEPKIEIRGVEHNGWLHLDVVDNGPGVGPTDEDKIFEPFFTTKPKDRGTGLGLAICRDILSAMGGTVSYLRNDKGQTVFRIELPLAAGDQSVATRVLSG
jgi:PAS domain S-box-containing protein